MSPIYNTRAQNTAIVISMFGSDFIDSAMMNDSEYAQAIIEMQRIIS